MAKLPLSDSFDYLCCGSTTIINIFYSCGVGIDLRRQNLRSLSKVDPSTFMVNYQVFVLLI